MKDLTKEEGNALIAKYMGERVSTVSGVPKVKYGRYSSRSISEWAKYHLSWDWLMPVLEKISEYKWPDYYNGREKDPEQDGEYDDNVYPRTFGMRDKEGLYMVRLNASQLFSGKTLIEATWLAVVDFIQWYNQNSNAVR